jgi:hypothetical protein
VDEDVEEAVPGVDRAGHWPVRHCTGSVERPGPAECGSGSRRRWRVGGGRVGASRSPSSRLPTPSMVPPAASSATHRFPATRWLTSARASQSAQGVAACRAQEIWVRDSTWPP